VDEAEKLLARMRASKAGWGEKEVDSLLLGFGFRYREGGKHRLYYHPKYPQLFATVARHGHLAKGYISTAVRLVDRLKEMEARDERGK
jgi:hypothetical protein